MMTRLVLAVLVIGGLGCGVDSGPPRASAPDDDRAASPQFLLCPAAPLGQPRSLCESADDCAGQGGAPGVLCNPRTGDHCCIFPMELTLESE